MSNQALSLAEIIETSLPEGWQARGGNNLMGNRDARLIYADRTQPVIIITITPGSPIAISTHNGLLSASFPQDTHPDTISDAVNKMLTEHARRIDVVKDITRTLAAKLGPGWETSNTNFGSGIVRKGPARFDISARNNYLQISPMVDSIPAGKEIRMGWGEDPTGPISTAAQRLSYMRNLYKLSRHPQRKRIAYVPQKRGLAI